MSKQINLNDNNWIDIVFENRNHEYGAYDIRKNYNKNSMLGVLGMFSFLGLAFGGILLFSSFKSTPPIPEVDPPLYDTIIIVMPDLPPLEEEEEIVVPKETQQSNFSDVIKNTIPDIVPDDKIPDELLPPTDEQLKDKTAGTTTIIGTGDEKPKEDFNEYGTGTGGNKPLLIAEVMPEFPGGEDALLGYINKHAKYTDMAREFNVDGTVYVSFVVDENGDVRDTKVERGIGYGMDEMITNVINGLPKFKPAEQNDKKVKVRMMIPVKFKLIK